MPLMLKSCLVCALLATAGFARADIYGFIDANGGTYLTNVKRDDRYQLIAKEPPVPVPAATGAAQAPAVAVNERAHGNPAYRKQYASLVTAVAKEQSLDAALMHAIVTVESGYNPQARSRKGAQGLMQLMPATAERYAVRNIRDPGDILRGGAKYLRDLLALFNNDLALALAAYNAGESAVIQAGNKIPPFAETRSYVPQVLALYQRYRYATP